jgi:hypothetical protein
MERMRSRILTTLAVLVAAFLLVTNPVVADAARTITGKDIKNGSVTGKDVKDGSLRAADLSAAGLAALTGDPGPIGPAGPAGPAGASAFAPAPVGTVVRGGGILNVPSAPAGAALREYVPLPVTTRRPLTQNGDGRNIWFGGGSFLPAAGETDTARCPGSFTAPTAASGALCVYIGEVSNAVSGSLVSGVLPADGDGADSSGFYVSASANGTGAALIRFTWAYTAG